MRGALDVRARNITTAMLLEAADGFASSIDQKRLSPDNIVPPIFSDETTPRIAEAVAQTAIEEGIALNPLPKTRYTPRHGRGYLAEELFKTFAS